MASANQNPPSDDNEQRIDGDGQEVNALRFLVAGGPPAPPPPAITPVSTGVSQPLQPPHQATQPQPAQTPHQPPQTSQSHAQQPIPSAAGYDYPDPSGYGSMQMPSVPMSGPYGMPGQVPGVMGGGPLMMMPPYNFPMYNPYMFPGTYPSIPSAPSNSSQFVAMLNVLRVKDPKFYREWYKKYTAHKRNPDRVPFPHIPGFPSVGGGPGSSQTLPSYGRTRKESSRSSVNGDSFRHAGNESFANLDYSHGPGGGANSSMSHAYPRTHDRHTRQPQSGRTSVNGDYRAAPEDDFEIDGADVSVLSGVGGNSILHSTHYSERDRPQTQSGRSSTEPYRLPPGDVYGGYPDQHQPDSLGYDNGYRFQPITEQAQVREPSPRRMTPLKFSTFHCIAAISPLGHLIRIKNTGTVLEFLKMKQFVGHLPEYKEMEAFPGPLIQGSIHKSTVIQFCRRKIKEARSNTAQQDKENYILLWEFLMLMLRQNGMVVGSDIAELLLSAVQPEEKKVVEVEEVRDDVEGSENSEEEESPVAPVDPPTEPEPRDEAKLVSEFCEHLLYGHKKDALDFAMDNGLWGHALFFASKMDERSYGHVLARFANGIALNSPLQTLYHIMCGKQPASVTSCAEESFGDWKPHLAMLLSNSGYKPEVEQKAILTLGDTLSTRNHTFAAQFCYLMGHEEFRKDSRLGPLLGFSGDNFLEAVQMTEVYEFARKLADPAYSLGVSFLHSKLEYAKSLVSYGFVQEALAYCEEITKTLKSRRIDEGELKLCSNTLQIAERIAVADESGLASSTWVEDLRKILYDPAIFLPDQTRKLSLVSSSQEQCSDQMSCTSQTQQHNFQQQQQQINQTHDPYDQYNQQNAGDGNSVSVSQFETAANSNNISGDPDSSYSGVAELPQDGSNWANANQMNGGLHMTQPQMYEVNQMQTHAEASGNQPGGGAVNPYGTNNGYEGNYQSLDAGYASGSAGGGGYDKLSGAPATANNNYWYNPYDSQPQPSMPMNTDYSGPKDHDPLSNAAVKKKSVRFEDEHAERAPATAASVEHIVGNGVQSVLRSRVRIADPIDLKSAMKLSFTDRQVEQRKDKEGNKKSSEFENSRASGEPTTPPPPPISNSLENDIDVETCGGSEERSLLDIEYKSTYPIDEPIEPSLGKRSQPSQPVSSYSFEFHNHKTSKTYPVDRECCDVNEPCDEHDELLSDEAEVNGEAHDLHDASQYPTYSYDDKTEILKNHAAPHSPSGGEKKSPEKKGKENKGVPAEGGWFSGLFKSLKPKIPKGPNQMILPDDKNPTIVWDDKLKRWVNTASDGEDDLAPAGPPPKDSDLMKGNPPPPMSNGPMNPMQMNPMQAAPPPQPNQMPNASYQNAPHAALQPLPNNGMPQGMMTPKSPNNEPMIPGMPPASNNSANKYKLQKGRSLKNSYVDVFNPNGPRAANGPPSLPANIMAAPQVPNLFIPPPSNQGGDGPVSFLTAAPPSEDLHQGQEGAAPAPPMFNPAQFHNPAGYPQGQ